MKIKTKTGLVTGNKTGKAGNFSMQQNRSDSICARETNRERHQNWIPRNLTYSL